MLFLFNSFVLNNKLLDVTIWPYPLFFYNIKMYLLPQYHDLVDLTLETKIIIFQNMYFKNGKYWQIFSFTIYHMQLYKQLFMLQFYSDTFLLLVRKKGCFADVLNSSQTRLFSKSTGCVDFYWSSRIRISMLWRSKPVQLNSVIRSWLIKCLIWHNELNHN